MGVEFGVLVDVRGDGYGEVAAEVVAAEGLGFGSAWLSEHHLSGDGVLPSPLVMAGVLLGRTERIRVGTNVLVLPFRHPVLVAEEAAVLDRVSGGRFVLGVGQGYAEREFEVFGVDRRRRGRLLEEGVGVIRRAWAGELGVTPRPASAVPIYVAGVTGAGLKRAARVGDGVIVYCATPQDFVARRRLMEEVLTEVPPLVCTGIMHVDEDADRAWARRRRGLLTWRARSRRTAGTSRPCCGGRTTWSVRRRRWRGG